MIEENEQIDEPQCPQVHRGELLEDRSRSRGDLKLIKRAIKNEWPIDSRLRLSLVQKMQEIIENSDDERNCIGAAKAIIQADSVNVKRESLDQADEHKRQPNLHLHAHADAAAKIVIQLPHNGR